VVVVVMVAVAAIATVAVIGTVGGSSAGPRPFNCDTVGQAAAFCRQVETQCRNDPGISGGVGDSPTTMTWKCEDGVLTSFTLID
jgi:hypothetical protein